MCQVLVNRLRPILKDAVTCNNNAFVQGWAISNNILLANEILTTIKRKYKGKSVLTSLKLNMFKAYDQVSWPFNET